MTLFTCPATSRAIHLECVEDMTAATFRRSLKNLVTRRGAPQQTISDNAKTFKSTAKWLKSVHANDKTQTLLNSLGISWRFNLSKAAWWGGFFERMVGLVKNSLKKCLGRSRLTFQELSRLMLDVEFSLNNRPLTYQGADLEMEPLTPNHLIYGRRMKEFRQKKCSAMKRRYQPGSDCETCRRSRNTIGNDGAKNTCPVSENTTRSKVRRTG
eukprot:Seg1357.1 transcript_id=Seg1357.1/GoldUCD/mRNA.D3Y31 product="hypothetical protein" protein_id=Seg1357.1/GoldUCD/D3Y31